MKTDRPTKEERPSKEELINYEISLLRFANEQVRQGQMSFERYAACVAANLRFIRTQIHERP